MSRTGFTRREILKGAAAAAGLAAAAPYVLTSAARGAEDAKAAADAKAAKDAKVGEAKAGEALKPLFNGKDLTDWDGDPRFWSVKDGAITGLTTNQVPTQGNTFCVWRGGTPKDFEFHAMFRLENHNSGIQFRSKTRDKWVMSGYQADMDEANTYTGGLYEEGGRGVLALPGQKITIGADGKPKVTGAAAEPKDVKAAIKNKDWNDLVITAQGNHITLRLNGLVTVDATDDDEKRRAMEGLIGLQLHAGQPMKVQFKDITLKVL